MKGLPVKAKGRIWTSEEKMKARQVSIIDVYRELYRRIVLPEDKQYWTMCGQCVNGITLDKGCEYDHIVNIEKIVSPENWYGIEINKDIYNLNKKIKEANWINNDIGVAISKEKKFNPGIINLDHHTASNNDRIDELTMIMRRCTTEEVMIVYNTILITRSYKTTVIKIGKEMFNNIAFKNEFIEKGWVLYPKYIPYKSNKGNTHMVTLILYKRG